FCLATEFYSIANATDMSTVSARYSESNSSVDGQIDQLIVEGQKTGAVVGFRAEVQAGVKTVCIDFKDRAVAYANVRSIRDVTAQEEGATTAIGDLCSMRVAPAQDEDPV